jgi:hypothetical protein
MNRRGNITERSSHRALQAAPSTASCKLQALVTAGKVWYGCDSMHIRCCGVFLAGCFPSAACPFLGGHLCGNVPSAWRVASGDDAPGSWTWGFDFGLPPSCLANNVEIDGSSAISCNLVVGTARRRPRPRTREGDHGPMSLADRVAGLAVWLSCLSCLSVRYGAMSSLCGLSQSMSMWVCGATRQTSHSFHRRASIHNYHVRRKQLLDRLGLWGCCWPQRARARAPA